MSQNGYGACRAGRLFSASFPENYPSIMSGKRSTAHEDASMELSDHCMFESPHLGIWPTYVSLTVPNAIAQQLHAYAVDICSKLNTELRAFFHLIECETSNKYNDMKAWIKAIDADSLHISLSRCLLLQRHEYMALRADLAETLYGTLSQGENNARRILIRIHDIQLLGSCIVFMVEGCDRLQLLQYPCDKAGRKACQPPYKDSFASVAGSASLPNSKMRYYHCSIVQLGSDIPIAFRDHIASFISHISSPEIHFHVEELKLYNGQQNVKHFTLISS